MELSRKQWTELIGLLHEVNKAAAAEMARWLAGNQYSREVTAVTAKAYELAERYGNQAAAAACEVYEMLAELQGAKVPSALPAEPPGLDQVEEAIRKTGLNRKHGMEDVVEKLVKQAGSDTLLQNAQRDGASFAWIPGGSNTCAFCLILASRGWQRIGKNAGEAHAVHIHQHCQCEYCIDFDGKTSVEGYEPDVYLEMYENAEGRTPQEKLNSMRRTLEARKKELESGGVKKISKPGNVNMKKPLVVRDITAESLSAARPGAGSFVIQDGYQYKDHENEVRVGKLIHRTFGGDLIVLAETNESSCPDYEWQHKLWDLKTPIREKNLSKLIQKGLHQVANNPGGVICDIKGLQGVPMGRIEQIITQRMRTSMTGALNVVIVNEDSVLKVLRYEK